MIQTYNWWGTGGLEPSPHLKTKRQLAEIGLKPVQPVGIIHCSKYDCLLFDPDNPESAVPKRKPSQKQLEVLALNRERQKRRRDYRQWYKDYGFIECDRAAAVRWAKQILEQNDWVILDTETTGLEDAEIIEIAIINSQAETLLNTLVKPTISIPPDSTAIHGITDDHVQNAPTFPEVFPKIVSALLNKQVLIYSASFDIRILTYNRKLHQLEPPLGLSKRSDCIMQWYSQWYGDWSNYWRSYRWQPLCGGHRALGDCVAAHQVIQSIAKDSANIAYPENIYPPPNYGWDKSEN